MKSLLNWITKQCLENLFQEPHLNFYACQVERHGMTFENFDAHLSPHQVKFPLWLRIFDFGGYLFPIASSLVYWFDSHLDLLPWFDIFRGFIPPVSGRSLTVPLLILMLGRFALIHWALSLTDLADYRFLAICKARSQSSIQEQDLGLNQQQYAKLCRMRRLVIRTQQWFSLFIFIITLIGRLRQSIRSGVWGKNPLASLFWLTIYLDFTYTTGTFAWGVAPFIFVVSFHLRLKQETILGEMYQLNRESAKPVNNQNRFWQSLTWRARLLKLAARYERLYRETLCYDHVIGRCLSTLFAYSIAIITITLYFIFFTGMPPFLNIAYSILCFTHIIYIAALIFGCAIITSDRISKEMTRFQYTTSPLYHHYRLHLESVVTNVIDSKLRFKLLNGTIVSSKLFFTVLWCYLCVTVVLSSLRELSKSP